MLCPECGAEFKGGQFFVTGERGAFRKCPQGHRFKEPIKIRKKSKEQAEIERLKDVLRQIANPRLSYRKCRELAIDALSPNEKLTGGPSGPSG